MWCINSTKRNTTLTRRWHPRGGKCEKQLEKNHNQHHISQPKQDRNRKEDHITPNLATHLRSERQQSAGDNEIAEAEVWNWEVSPA